MRSWFFFLKSSLTRILHARHNVNHLLNHDFHCVKGCPSKKLLLINEHHNCQIKRLIYFFKLSSFNLLNQKQLLFLINSIIRHKFTYLERNAIPDGDLGDHKIWLFRSYNSWPKYVVSQSTRKWYYTQNLNIKTLLIIYCRRPHDSTGSLSSPAAQQILKINQLEHHSVTVQKLTMLLYNFYINI